MLAVTSYSKDHVDNVRTTFDQQVVAYEAIKSTPEFDSQFFPNLVLALDRCFVHRQRSLEGKDGNALNELRVLCDSIVDNRGVLRTDKTIKFKPEESVTGIAVGEEIRLDARTFKAFAQSVLEEIERRYP